MGNRYNYKIWVPRESLFDALSQLSRYSTSPDFERLIWPDGRRIRDPQLEEDFAEVTSDDEAASDNETLQPKADLIPIDSTYSGSFSMTFDFEPDEELQRFDLETQRDGRQKGHTVESVLKDGRYSIENIDFSVSLKPSGFRWFGSSPLFNCLEFEAAYREMSQLFHDSPSVRRFFDDLALELGAALCTLDIGFTPEYITVERYKYGMHPGWFSDFDVAEDFDAAVEVSPYLSRSENALQQKARYCASQESELARLLLYIQDSESNLRARAYHALNDEDKDLVATVLKAGLDDEDWRVRAVVVTSLSRINLSMVEGALLQALEDPHPDVRSIASEKFRRFNTDAVFETLLKIVEETPLTPPNLGLFKNALEGLRLNAAGWNAAAVVEKRLAEPDFPFPEEAKRVIGSLQSRREIGEPEA